MKKLKFGFLMIMCAVLICGSLCFTGCTNKHGETPPTPVHLLAESDVEANPIRPIDSKRELALSEIALPVTTDQYYYRLNTLYDFVVVQRVKPIFIENDPVKPVYDSAIKLLNRYIKNDWSDYYRIHSLHDYLVSQIEYDHELYNEFLQGGQDTLNASTMSQFNLDGVLLDKKAVCDGISKAFAFLCAIEDIDAVQVSGAYTSNGTSIPHAWNKVKMREALSDETVSERWYNIDATMDMANYAYPTPDSIEKVLAHGFFLVSDTSMERTHSINTDDGNNYPCNYNYDYFDNKFITIGSRSYRIKVTSQEDLNAIFKAISDNRSEIGKIELQLDFPNILNDNYDHQIAAAYAYAKNYEFKLDISQTPAILPCFQYANGVFLFLIYH